MQLWKKKKNSYIFADRYCTVAERTLDQARRPVILKMLTIAVSFKYANEFMGNSRKSTSEDIRKWQC